MTPLDVVKIRLQVQQRAEAKCFLYCNGLMDHICGCAPNENNGNKQWFKRPGHFNGTLVRTGNDLRYLLLFFVFLGCFCKNSKK